MAPPRRPLADAPPHRIRHRPKHPQIALGYIPKHSALIHLTSTPERGTNISEHHDTPKAHEPHAVHEDHTKGPHDPKIINPKISSDIHYWSKEFGVTGEQLHEAIRTHGTHVDKVRAALHPHKS